MTTEELISAACAYSLEGQRIAQSCPLNDFERTKLRKLAKHYKITPVQTLRFLLLKAEQELNDG